jgi:ribosomal-protein-alanine N-acetyltransferase
MSGWFTRLFSRRPPVLGDARPADAAALSALHAASFSRGWSEDEMERLLLDLNVIAHRAVMNGRVSGFILSRRAADEAEILSVAVDRRKQGNGIARALLDLNLRRLAGLGVRTVFLEVDENNVPARKLYARAGFEPAGRRAGYYVDARGNTSPALVLRRDLA